jgi:hypothetical protein
VWGQGNAVPADKKPAFDSLITFIPMAMNLPYAVLRDELNASFDTLRQNWQFEHWNAGRLEIRGGAVWNSSDSTWSNLATRKFSCAVSYSGRLFKSIRRSQFTFAAQGSRHWASSLGEGVPNLKWSWEGGARYMVLLSGKREDEQRFRAYLGGRMAWANYTLPDGSDSTVLDGRLTAGVEFRLAKGTWAELAIANQITNVNEANALGRMRFLPMGGLKYTLNSQPRFSETRN